MWEQVIASVWGTTTNCKGEQNSRNDGKGGVSQKYWEVLERWKRAILLQKLMFTSNYCKRHCLAIPTSTFLNQ
jgi:hypothetical protein